MNHHPQPLRIPSGWKVAYNQFYETRPEDVTEDNRYDFLQEDILQFYFETFIRLEPYNRMLDVGWYPAGNLKQGSYGLVVHENDFHGKLLFELQTKDHSFLVTEIERLMQEISELKL